MSKALFMALCFLCISAQAETKLNFTGDAYVRGYFKNSSGPDGTQAFNQFFRVNVDSKPDENLTIKTGLVLSSNTWEGDSHTTNATGVTATATNEDGSGGGDTTHLDHAYFQYNSEEWMTTIGRQAVSSPGNFLTSDDRRDRLQVLKFQGLGALALIYDKRTEGTLANGRDDLDMYSICYFEKKETFNLALLTGYWRQKNRLSLDNVKQVTPQISGQALGIDYNFYYTILWGGATLFKQDHHSAAFHFATDLEILKVDFESTFTKHGGLIAGGFDTLSSIINNNPDHNQSSIKLRNIGQGLGIVKKDEYAHIIKFSKNVSPKISASLGGGYVNLLSTLAGTTIEKNSVLDATAKYTFTKNMNMAAAYGRFFGDNKDHAGSLTLNANF